MFKKLSLTTALLAAFSIPHVSAEAQTPVFDVGDMQVTVIDDKQNSFARELFENLDPALESYFEKGAIAGVVRTFLIKSDNKLILVDSGFGIAQGGRTEAVLKELGIAPDEITDILLTHFDGDHILGLAHNGAAAFDKASLHVASAEYEAWIEKGIGRAPQAIDTARRILNLYGDRIVIFGFGQEVLPGITAYAATGHTMGHVRFDLDSAGEAFTIAGDLLHAYPLQMHHPQVNSAYDNNKDEAAATRDAVLRELSQKGRPVAFTHLIPIGKITAREAGGYDFINQE